MEPQDMSKSRAELALGQGTEPGLVIDCGSCTAKPVACDGCVVSFMLGSPQGTALESEDVRVLDVLADSGLVPPLRLLRGESGKMAG